MQESDTRTLPFAERHRELQFQDYPDGQIEAAHPINFRELYQLKGRLLTLVDATFTDPAQRKAQKDLVWQTLQAWMEQTVMSGGCSPPHDPPTE